MMNARTSVPKSRAKAKAKKSPYQGTGPAPYDSAVILTPLQVAIIFNSVDKVVGELICQGHRDLARFIEELSDKLDSSEDRLEALEEELRDELKVEMMDRDDQIEDLKADFKRVECEAWKLQQKVDELEMAVEADMKRAEGEVWKLQQKVDELEMAAETDEKDHAEAIRTLELKLDRAENHAYDLQVKLNEMEAAQNRTYNLQRQIDGELK